MTTIESHSHAGSQALGEVRNGLLTYSCGSSCQMVCKATFNSSAVHRLLLEFMILFRHGDGPADSNGDSMKPIVLLNDPVRFEPVVHDAGKLRNGGERT